MHFHVALVAHMSKTNTTKGVVKHLFLLISNFMSFCASISFSEIKIHTSVLIHVGECSRWSRSKVRQNCSQDAAASGSIRSGTADGAQVEEKEAAHHLEEAGAEREETHLIWAQRETARLSPGNFHRSDSQPAGLRLSTCFKEGPLAAG